MIHELVIAFLLGLIGGVIPGPVITTVFTEILQAGFHKGMRIILIALVAESSVAVICLVILDSMDFNEAFFRGLSLAGALILVWISISIWKIRSLDTGEKIHFSVGKVAVMIFSNGVLWTYWITICIPKAILLGEEIQWGAYIFMGLVQAGWFLSTVVVAFLFSRFRSILSRPRVIPLVFRIFAGAFAYFAVDMAYKSILFFLQ